MNTKLCWIIGSSSGIGEELAKELARAGYIVAASARSSDKLEQLASGDYSTGKIISYSVDVTDLAALKNVAVDITQSLGPINMAILCAGTYIPDSADAFNSATIQTQFTLNVMGVAHALEVILPLMKHQAGAHIAVVASVAGFRGLPYATGYGGTKAALINMTESLKPQCDQLGIKLQLICPGFVKTPLTDKNEFPMPFLISVEEAARSILSGLKSDRFEITFPWPMKIVMKLLRFLPYNVFFMLTRKMCKPISN